MQAQIGARSDEKLAHAKSNPVLKEGFWRNELVGLSIIDFEQQACDFSPDELRRRKDFYLSFVRSAVAALEKMGLANPVGREGVLTTWSEISALVWGKFRPVRILPTLVDGMDPENPVLDCDTGSFLAADIFAQIGVKCHIAGVDQHTLLLVKTDDGNTYIDVKKNYGKRHAWEIQEGRYYYTSRSQAEKEYGKIYYELKFGADQPYLYDSRGNEHYARREYQSAVRDYNAAIRMGLRDPDTYYNLGLAYFELGKFELAAENFEKSNELNPDQRVRERIDEARKASLKTKTPGKADGHGKGNE